MQAPPPNSDNNTSSSSVLLLSKNDEKPNTSPAPPSTSPANPSTSTFSALSLEFLSSCSSLSSSPSPACLHSYSDAFLNFNHRQLLQPSDYQYPPSQLAAAATPSSATSSCLPLSNAHHSQALKKRLAVCPIDDFPALPKRLCEMDMVCNVTTPFVGNQFSPCNFGRDHVEEGAMPSTGDLDDVLDFFLQGAADMIPPSLATSPGAYAAGSGGASTMMVSSELSIVPSMHSPHYGFAMGDGNGAIELKSTLNKFPQLARTAPAARFAFHNDDIVDDHVVMVGGSRIKNETWGNILKGQDQQGTINVVRGINLCEEWLRQRPGNTELSCPVQHKQQKQGYIGNGIISPAVSSPVPKSSSSRCAGPTLMDIESALALTCSSPAINYPPLVSSSLEKDNSYHPPGGGLSSVVKDILHQETTSFLTRSSSSPCKEEPTTSLLVEEDADRFWRRLQKGSQNMEPRYTVKMRCQEDAVSIDGYRWRKYGQKSIKDSPHPRSYYRCSSGKCGVKKQVERSSEDAGVLVVSYEGIHLHHRPLINVSPSHAATLPIVLHHTHDDAPAPAPPCQGGDPTPPPPPFPTTSTDDNNTSTPLSRTSYM